MNNTTITIVVTTRVYPFAWDCGEKFAFDASKLDMGNDEERKVYNVNPCIKTGRFVLEHVEYMVYVVPCLKDGNQQPEEIKDKYFESIIESVGLREDGLESVYLVAHDKDFILGGQSLSGSLVKRTNLPRGVKSNPILSKLIEMHHAYMFQHGDEGVGEIVGKLRQYDENGKCMFSKQDCATIINTVDQYGLMIKHFVSVDNNPQNTYPNSII